MSDYQKQVRDFLRSCDLWRKSDKPPVVLPADEEAIKQLQARCADLGACFAEVGEGHTSPASGTIGPAASPDATRNYYQLQDALAALDAGRDEGTEGKKDE
jgi:hypothetical protein